jgi:hypothetical protein
MKMRAFYGSRFSKNMTVTPEGFLICHNVPISRVGWYEYLGDEIGADDQSGKVVKVFRSPEEVFSAGAIASFEGKPVTDEHPPELVTPENATRYAKGAVQNVRQGSGQETDLLLADLVIYDQTLINEVQDGKREVSCGYDVNYLDNGDGTYSQQQISGNHVAVVKSGRAGNRVAIKDSKEKNPNPEGAMKMANKIKLPKKQSRVTDLLAAIGLKQFALDADPDEIKEAVDAMAEERTEDGDDLPPQQNPNPTGDEAKDPAIAALEAKVDKCLEMCMKMCENMGQGQAQDGDPEKAIDDAISELEKAGAQDDDEEESHTVPADTMDDEGPEQDPEDRPKNPIPGADNAYKIQALKAIKPILAAIPDKAERKKATDAAIASIKGKPSQNTYGQMAKRKKKPATDNHSKAVDHSQLGKDIAKKYNPHYKERA